VEFRSFGLKHRATMKTSRQIDPEQASATGGNALALVSSGETAAARELSRAGTEGNFFLGAEKRKWHGGRGATL
jgi:hypothetical protein